MVSERLNRYTELISQFVRGESSTPEFERQYLDLFKHDPEPHSEETYLILDQLFSDVDAFCADSTLRTPQDLDEPQLRTQAEIALEKLKALRVGA